MNRLHQFVFLFLAVSWVSVALAQDSGPSLGNLARQERARKEKQHEAGQVASTAAYDTPGGETAALKEGQFQANILITDSNAAIEKWVMLPDGDRGAAGRFREVTPGKKLYVPFVVTHYAYETSERMYLSAHVQFVNPNGKVLFDGPKFSGALAPDPRSPNTIVLNPIMDITFDSRDIPGTYTVRVIITDHVHSTYAKAEEKFQLVQGKVAGAEKSSAQNKFEAARNQPTN